MTTLLIYILLALAALVLIEELHFEIDADDSNNFKAGCFTQNEKGEWVDYKIKY